MVARHVDQLLWGSFCSAMDADDKIFMLWNIMDVSKECHIKSSRNWRTCMKVLMHVDEVKCIS